MNQVFLKGNVSRDPELKFLSSGSALCNFGIAVQDGYMKDGQWQKGQTSFFDVTVFGKSAERANDTISKGSLVVLTGKLKQETWDDKNTGTKRSKVSITAFTVDVIERHQRQDTQDEPKDDGDLPW